MVFTFLGERTGASSRKIIHALKYLPQFQQSENYQIGQINLMAVAADNILDTGAYFGLNLNFGYDGYFGKALGAFV